MATTRNPENVQPVVDGQVLVSFATERPQIGLDGHFGDAWDTVGILNKGSKLGLQRAMNKNKTEGWGFGVVAVATSPGDLTGSCEVLEDNPSVQRIAWPARTSPDASGAAVLIHDGEVARPYVAYVEDLQNGKRRIRASRYPAYATMENLDQGEEVEGKQVDFDFEPGADKDVFDEITIDVTAGESSVEVVMFSATANAGSGEPGA